MVDDPPQRQGGPRGSGKVRRVVARVRARWTTRCQCKQVRQRGWPYGQAGVAVPRARFNMLVPWPGLQPDEDGSIQLSIAEFSL